MTDDTYNGWKNRESWLLNLWLMNAEDSYDAVVEAVGDLIQLDPTATNRQLGDGLHDIVRAWWEQDSLDFPGGLWFDLVGTALGRVDWEAVVAPIATGWWEARCEPNGIH